MFTKNIVSGAFRSLHCLIYKVLARPPQRRSMFYLTTSSGFCQALFSTFSKFFGACRSFSPLSQTAHLFYQSFLSLSSTFFASLEVFSPSTLARPPCFRQLAYYTSPFALCQHFFLKFFNNLQNTPSPLNTGYSFPSSYLQISSRRTQIAWFSALFRVHIVNLSYILLIAHRVSYC